MKRNLENKRGLVILKGDRESAMYREQVLEEYGGNPFIEALPDILSEDDIIDKFTIAPMISEHDLHRDIKYRYHIIKRIKNFIQPLPIHFTLERRLSILIRRGYLARNPLDKHYLERLRILNKVGENHGGNDEIIERMQHIRSTADSLSIIGISGMGKTTAIEKILLMYPQIIKHEEYKGKRFTATQIVWIKIDCPYDGSLSTLCKSFFKAIDDLLGTRYLEKFGYSTRITSSMMLHMTRLASMYGIGVLVIDEIQHLLNSRNDMEEMLNFFVTLSNTVGIPTVLIGTSRAQRVFSGNFRQARRAASEGAVMWDRMVEGSVEWNLFLDRLWTLQCLKKNTLLTDEIREVFYQECQGITAVAVNLFILIQERALSEEKENISIRLIRDTAKDDLQMIQPIIKAIRNKNLREIAKYDDISLDLDEIIINHEKNIDLNQRIQELFKDRKESVESRRKNTVENLVIDLMEMFEGFNTSEMRKICERIVEKANLDEEYISIKKKVIKKAMDIEREQDTKVNKCGNKQLVQGGLLDIYESSISKKEHVYEGLKRKGFIKNPIDEFLN